VVPTRPIDIWGIAGSVPNGFVFGTACTATAFWVEDLPNIKTKNNENTNYNIRTHSKDISY